MDIYTGSFTKRNENYFLVMARLEADALLHTAKRASYLVLKNYFNRGRFEHEIQNFCESQLAALKTAKNDTKRKICVANLVQEKRFLEKQSAQVRTGSAKLHASVVVTQDHKGVWSYLIDGVGVVLGGLQVVGGVGLISTSLATGNVIGVVAGTFLILHGINSTQEGAGNIMHKKSDTIGFMRDAYILSAEFMGFKGSVGAIAFSVMDLSLSGYGMARLALKPDTWRLFRYMNNDFIINIKTMSKTALTIEAYNDGWAIKSVMDNQH